MTAFVLPNNLSHNRFGVTASRKAIGKRCSKKSRQAIAERNFSPAEIVYKWFATKVRLGNQRETPASRLEGNCGDRRIRESGT